MKLQWYTLAGWRMLGGDVEAIKRCAVERRGEGDRELLGIDVESEAFRAARPARPARPKPEVRELPAPVVRLMEVRAAVCQECEHMKQLRTIPRTQVQEVYCAKQRKRCSHSNGEVRLDVGRCPLDRWKELAACGPDGRGPVVERA